MHMPHFLLFSHLIYVCLTGYKTCEWASCLAYSLIHSHGCHIITSQKTFYKWVNVQLQGSLQRRCGGAKTPLRHMAKA